MTRREVADPGRRRMIAVQKCLEIVVGHHFRTPRNVLLHPAIGAASRRDIGADGYLGRCYRGVEVDAADDRGACGERCDDGRRPRPWNQAEAGEDRADEERRQRNQIAGLVGSARAVDEQHEDGSRRRSLLRARGGVELRPRQPARGDRARVTSGEHARPRAGWRICLPKPAQGVPGQRLRLLNERPRDSAIARAGELGVVAAQPSRCEQNCEQPCGGDCGDRDGPATDGDRAGGPATPAQRPAPRC